MVNIYAFISAHKKSMRKYNVDMIISVIFLVLTLFQQYCSESFLYYFFVSARLYEVNNKCLILLKPILKNMIYIKLNKTRCFAS